jgi:hypothetical protein
MGSELPRFVEADQPVKYLGDFDHVLMHCPRCDGMAVRRAGRVTCGSCAYSDGFQPLPKTRPHIEPPRNVTCPRCNRFVGTDHTILRMKQFRCEGCGWTKGPGAGRAWAASHRPRMIRLWLETEFRGQRLWAVNEQHLSYLEAYVAAGVRETTVPSNGTIASRLPAWIKSAKNREALLRELAKLRARLP